MPFGNGLVYLSNQIEGIRIDDQPIHRLSNLSTSKSIRLRITKILKLEVPKLVKRAIAVPPNMEQPNAMPKIRFSSTTVDRL